MGLSNATLPCTPENEVVRTCCTHNIALGLVQGVRTQPWASKTAHEVVLASQRAIHPAAMHALLGEKEGRTAVTLGQDEPLVLVFKK